eukprot:scaffold77534_cov46-Prasinocladus_malaysianus.AAC.2
MAGRVKSRANCICKDKRLCEFVKYSKSGEASPLPDTLSFRQELPTRVQSVSGLLQTSQTETEMKRTRTHQTRSGRLICKITQTRCKQFNRNTVASKAAPL